MKEKSNPKIYQKSVLSWVRWFDGPNPSERYWYHGLKNRSTLREGIDRLLKDCKDYRFIKESDQEILVEAHHQNHYQSYIEYFWVKEKKL